MNLDFCEKTKIAAIGLVEPNSIENILQQKTNAVTYINFFEL
jgi:hypothetical protein